LPKWQVTTFPYFLLKERGLLDDAALTSAERKP
jgi:hypothetical protein